MNNSLNPSEIRKNQLKSQLFGINAGIKSSVYLKFKKIAVVCAFLQYHKIVAFNHGQL